jgi:hypothetical protein
MLKWYECMIHYHLLCEHEHKFEAWFRDSAAFDEQASNGEIECPFCGNEKVRKAVMAPAVSTRNRSEKVSKNQQLAIDAAEKVVDDVRDGVDPHAVAKQFLEVVIQLQKHVEETCDYVGESFAKEARAIHYGDAEKRNIYGESSLEEAKGLSDEGIEVMALPKLFDKDRAN